MSFRRLVVATMFSVAAVYAAASPQPPWTGVLLSPGDSPVPPGFTSLVRHDDAVGELLSAQEAFLTQLPLDAETTVDAILSRIDPFTPETRLVVVGDDGEYEIAHPAVASFRGTLAGYEGSSIFISVSPWWVYGYATLDDRTFIISSGPATDPRDPVVYDTARISPDDLAIVIPTCQTDESYIINQAAQRTSDAHGSTTRAGPCRIAKVAWESDYELTQIFGGDPNLSTAYISLVTAAMTDIYLRDVNTRIVTPYIRVWTTSADPWDQPSTGAQLDQFRAHWATKMWSVSRNLAHFLSGRGLGGGVAWVGVVCNSQYGYALSANLAGSFPYPLQDNRGVNWDPYVIAHELGHNFGTLHTHDYTPPIDTCGLGQCAGYLGNGTIMSYCHLCFNGVANIKLKFGDRVNERILTYLADEAPCELADPPKFNSHPGNKTVDLGATVTFTPAVTTPGLPQYQWFHDDVAIPNAKAQQLTITNVGPDDIGAYVLRVSNECNTVFSNPGTLLVRCPADFDGSLFVDNDDFNLFVEAFVAGGMNADFDKSGFVDIDDYTGYVLAFEAGC